MATILPLSFPISSFSCEPEPGDLLLDIESLQRTQRSIRISDSIKDNHLAPQANILWLVLALEAPNEEVILTAQDQHDLELVEQFEQGLL